MPRKAGHNQPNFKHGIRDTGPNPDNYFTSASRLENYDVTSAGHLKRRKHVEEVGTFQAEGTERFRQGLDTRDTLRGRTIKEIVPFYNDNFNRPNGNKPEDYGVYFLILFTDGSLGLSIEYTSDGSNYGNQTIEHIACTPYNIRRYELYVHFNVENPSAAEVLGKENEAIFSGAAVNVGEDRDREAIDPEDAHISRIIQAGDFIWAIPSNHFAPFIIEVANNKIEVYPLYMANRDAQDFYPLLRTIPLNPSDDVIFEDFSSDTRALQKYVKLYIDKSSNIDSNECLAWLGMDLPAGTDAPLGDMDTDMIGLKQFIGKPLFFNVLPTKAFRLTEDPGYYDNEDNYTGDLAGLQTLTDIANFETGNLERLALIREMLFGRKYCIIPQRFEAGENIANKTYSNIFQQTAAAIPARTSATFTFAALADPETFEYAVPSDAYLTLLPKELDTGTYEDTSRELTGNFTYNNITFDRSASSTVDYDVDVGSRRRSGSRIVTIEIDLDMAKLRGEFARDGSATSNLISNRDPFDGKITYKYRSLLTGRNSDNWRDIQDRLEDALDADLDDADTFSDLMDLLISASSVYSDTDIILNNFRMEFDPGVWTTATRPDTVEFGGYSFNAPGTSTTYIKLSDTTISRGRGATPHIFNRSGVATVVFKKNNQVVYPRTPGRETGTKHIGWQKADPRGGADGAQIGGINLVFNDLTNSARTISAEGKFKADTLFSKFESFVFERNYSNNTYSLFIYTSTDESTALNSLTGISYGGVTKSLGSRPSPTREGSNYKFSYRLSDSALYDKAAELNAARFSLTGLTPEYDTIEDLVTPIYGWSKGNYSYPNGSTGLSTMNKSSKKVNVALTDNQGLLALGYQLYNTDDGIKYTPFVFVKKTAQVASAPTASVTFGGTSYTLEGNDVPGSVELQAFRLADDALLSNAPNFTGDYAVTLTFNTTPATPYQFTIARPAEVRSQVRANCLIFELGMPSVDKATNSAERYIGGNDYDNTHTKVNRVVEGLDLGFSDAVALGLQELWCIRDSKLYKFSKDTRLYSNSIINRLNDSTSKEYIDVLAKSGIKLENLANTSTTANANEFEILSKYLAVKNIDIADQPEFRAIEAYFSEGYVTSAGRNYSLELTDLSGDNLEVTTMSPNFNATGAYFGTDRGVFQLVPTTVQGVDFDVLQLLSRQRVKSNMIALNNKLVFINSEKTLLALTFSDERKGYVEQKYGVFQQEFFRDIKSNERDQLYNLVFNPQEDAYYALTKQVYTGSYMFPILRAINMDEDIVGFSSYTFRRFQDMRYWGEDDNITPEVLNKPYASPELLFVTKNILHAVMNREGSKSIVRFFNAPTGVETPTYDFAETLNLVWQSAFSSNRLIFNNLSGMDGATALIGVDKVAMFVKEKEFPLDPDNYTGLGPRTFNNQAVVYQFPLTISVVNPQTGVSTDIISYETPTHDIENVLDFRTELYFRDGRKNKQGTIFGFQATTAMEAQQI